MQQIMAVVSGADITSIRLLTDDLTFGEKRHTLFRLLRHRAIPLDRIDEIQNYLRILHTFTPLRNDIAHSAWTEGKPANLISPAWLTHGPIRAVQADHGGDPAGAEPFANYEEQVAFTLENLQGTVDNLKTNYARFLAFAKTADLVPANNP